MPKKEHTQYQDEDLVRLFKVDPDRALGYMFDRYYQEVCRHIYRIIPVREITEDIAQSIYMELWRKRRDLDIRTSVGAYLHRMAVSRSLNYIRDHKRFQHGKEDEMASFQDRGPGPLQEMIDSELQSVINAAIESLPERCRLVFVLSRFEEMSYREIGEALDISVKTVENQISKALQILRSTLSDYDRGDPPE